MNLSCIYFFRGTREQVTDGASSKANQITFCRPPSATVEWLLNYNRRTSYSQAVFDNYILKMLIRCESIN